jgi:hypothetical protein
VNVVQYYPHGNKILRDAEVLATLTRLFTVADEQIGLQNEAVQEALINTVAQFSRLEGELVLLRRKNKPKPATYLVSDSEHSILLDHKFQLEQNIDSLEKQVNFLRDNKKKNDDKLKDQLERQAQQIAHLNGLLEQATREKDECLLDFAEKEKTLQATIVHLTAAQEEIRHYSNERNQSKLKDKQNADEMNDIIQRHSKYSAAQFTQLSAQLDALRVELKKEKSERLRERDDLSRENSLLQKKLLTSESMAEALHKRFTDIVSIGLHNYNVQTGSTIEGDVPLPLHEPRDDAQSFHSEQVNEMRNSAARSSTDSFRSNQLRTSNSQPRSRNGTPTAWRRSSSRSRGRAVSNASHYDVENEDAGGEASLSRHSRSISSVRPKARHYQQVENMVPEKPREYKHEGPVKSLRGDPEYLQRLVKAEENRRRSRSESPSFRGRHILFQPAVIQTSVLHAHSLQHPLRLSSSGLPDDLAQRLVYSQNSSVLSPESKRKLRLEKEDADALNDPSNKQFNSTLHISDVSNRSHALSHGAGGASAATVVSDHDSDAISSIPKPDGDEDDDNVLMFDHQQQQHIHNASTGGERSSVSVNGHAVHLPSRTASGASSPRLTEYMFDANLLEGLPNNPNLQHQLTPQGGPFHHRDFPIPEQQHQAHRSGSSEQDPSSGDASFAVSSTLPSQRSSPLRTSQSIFRSSAEGGRLHPPQHPGAANAVVVPETMVSPLTSPSPAAINNRNAARYYNSTWQQQPHHAAEKDIGTQHASEISLKFTNKAPRSQQQNHQSQGQSSIRPTFSADATVETPQQRVYDLFPHQLQPDGDETVVSQSTALPPNHKAQQHHQHLSQFHSSTSDSKNLPLHNATNSENNNDNIGTWNILFQKKEYLDVDNASHLDPKDALVSGTLLHQVLEVYNQTVDDYNALLRAHREEYAEHERVKSDFKEEIYESVSKIHDLQTKLHALSLENEHFQGVLSKRGTDGMTVTSAPAEDSLLLQQQMLMNQQTQEMLQQMQDRWVESEQKVAELIAQSSNVANNTGNGHAGLVEYAFGIDRSTHDLPKLIKLFEDNCQFLTNLPSEKIVVSKLFVWDLLQVLNNIQHHILRQLHQVQTSSESLEKKSAQQNQEVASLQHRVTEKEQALKQLQSQHSELQQQHDEKHRELTHQQKLYADWQQQHERLQHQFQELQAQLIRQEQEHEDALHQRLQQEYANWQAKHHKTNAEVKTVEEEEEAAHLQQLKVLHEQLAHTRHALEEMKQTQEEARQEDQSLLKLLMESSSAVGGIHRLTSHESEMHKEPHYQEDLHYISDLKNRLDHLHKLLANDPKYRQYVNSEIRPGSDNEPHEYGEEEGMKIGVEEDQLQSLMLSKIGLEDRLMRAEARVQLLTQQLENMPASLTVAQAEKRVLEAKLAKAIEAHDFNIQKLQFNAVQKIQEMNAFLELERQEKESLQAQLHDQQSTIHRLTHHLKLLQAQGQTAQRETEVRASIRLQKDTHHGHHHPISMSTATALDILKHSPQRATAAAHHPPQKEAALSTLGLSLGHPAPWEVGAMPRPSHSSSSSTIAAASSVSPDQGTTSAPPSRRTTPQRQRSAPPSSNASSPVVGSRSRSGSGNGNGNGSITGYIRHIKPSQEPLPLSRYGTAHSASTQPLFH